VNVIVAYWGNFHPGILQSPSLVPRRGMEIIQSTLDRIKPETQCGGKPQVQRPTSAEGVRVVD
jgi:hypothetical protein